MLDCLGDTLSRKVENTDSCPAPKEISIFLIIQLSNVSFHFVRTLDDTRVFLTSLESRVFFLSYTSLFIKDTTDMTDRLSW